VNDAAVHVPDFFSIASAKIDARLLAHATRLKALYRVVEPPYVGVEVGSHQSMLAEIDQLASVVPELG
jgi:hypothetical protein